MRALHVVGNRGVHGDGILVPSPTIPADLHPSPPIPALILTHLRKKFDPSPQAPTYFCQPEVVIIVTIVAILKIPHSAALAVNFKL